MSVKIKTRWLSAYVWGLYATRQGCLRGIMPRIRRAWRQWEPQNLSKPERL